MFLWGDTGNDTRKICMEFLDACGPLNNHVQLHALHHPRMVSPGKCARLCMDYLGAHQQKGSAA